MTTNQERPTSTCYCGAQTTGYHSGQFECDRCWTWRKLDEPAARHWAKVGAEFLSNIDMWDATHFFPAAGLDQDMAVAMIDAAKRLTQYSLGMIIIHEQHLPYPTKD